MVARIALASALIVLLSTGAKSQEDRARWLGAYSNVRIVAQAGDLIGIHLLVIPGNNGKTYVLFQEMQGGLACSEEPRCVWSGDSDGAAEGHSIYD